MKDATSSGIVNRNIGSLRHLVDSRRSKRAPSIAPDPKADLSPDPSPRQLPVHTDARGLVWFLTSHPQHRVTRSRTKPGMDGMDGGEGREKNREMNGKRVEDEKSKTNGNGQRRANENKGTARMKKGSGEMELRTMAPTVRRRRRPALLGHRQAGEQLLDGDIERVGEDQQRRKRRLTLAALQQAHVRAMKRCRFGQGFLRGAALLSKLTKDAAKALAQRRPLDLIGAPCPSSLQAGGALYHSE